MPSSYPFDPTGIAPSNLIVNEIHSLSNVINNNYKLIVPNFSPFYLDNLSLSHINNGVITPLVESVDYTVCLPYLGASRSIGKLVYGALSINNNLLNGDLKLQYQTIGGEWVADSSYVIERLAEIVFNKRITVWDVITNVQNIFPPINHDQSLDYVKGMEELLNKLNEIVLSIQTGPNINNNAIRHLINTDNPHQTTKEQIELGNVENLRVATDQEINDRTPVRAYVTLEQVLALIN